jgi:hypothetical protein
MPTLLTADSEKQELWEEIQRLRRELDRTLKEREKTRRELEEYKKRHPETVGVKHGKAYEIKPSPKPQPAADPPTEKRKPGGQPGHKGHHRKQPDHVDRTVHARIRTCPDCDGRLSRIQETRQRIIEDVPQVQSVVTRFLIDRRYCKKCRTLVDAPVQDALPGARIGLRAMLIVAWLRYACRVPQDVAPDLLRTLLGLTISTGEVQSILDQLAKAYGPVYEKLVADLRSRPSVNPDETSWRQSGQNRWLWAFVTRWETVYHIAQGRGHQVALEILGQYEGTVCSDRMSAYDTFASKTGAPQQFCWAHILGDAKELAEFYPEEGKPLLRSLKAVYAHAVRIAPNGTPEDVELLEDALAAALDHAYTSNHCARFARNVLKDAAHLFRFVTDPSVDSTNNRAERALRPMVVARKVSGGSRSDKGVHVRAVLSSILRSMDQRGLDLLGDTPKALLTSHG